MMARSDEQRELFTQAAVHRIIIPVIGESCHEDVRRPDAHRRVWMKKKTRKKLGALGRGKFVGELTSE